VREEKVE